MLHWSEIWKYSAENPLLFSSYLFFALFTLAYGIFTLVYKKPSIRNIFLLGFSLFFYYKSGGYYFWLLIFSTIIDYSCGNIIYKATKKHIKKLMLILSLVANLGMLAFFKYAYYIIDLINANLGTELKAINIFALAADSAGLAGYDIYSILLPVGISFYTFQTLSYTIDIYRGNLKPAKNIIDFGFFVTFFPQLVAGPIVRATDFFPQMYKPFKLTKQVLGASIFLIMAGLFKKVVISDYISVNFIDSVFENPLAYSGFSNIMAIYGYAVQIYCDFSGYSDMAIGIAALFGFTLPLNFNRPYQSLSITEFWRRWHISLSSWLRDYLYISLGGNRKGKLRTYVNLMLTMLIGGLWHGAATRFIIWGGLHGMALAVHKVWKEHKRYGSIAVAALGGLILAIFGWQGWAGDSSLLWCSMALILFVVLIFALDYFKVQLPEKSIVYRGFMAIVTFHFVCFCWIYFRAENLEIMSLMFEQMHTKFSGGDLFSWEDIKIRIVEYKKPFGMIIFGLALHFTPIRWRVNVADIFSKSHYLIKASVFVFLIVLVYQFKSADIVPFIYFDF